MTHETEARTFHVIRQKFDGNFLLKSGGIYHDFTDSDAHFDSWDNAFQHWAYEIDRHEILYVEASYELTVERKF